MRAVIQRVSHACVTVDGTTIGKIASGLLVLLGVSTADTQADAQFIIDKIPQLRIFEDENGKMNLSLLDVQGELLVVSQFTLLGDAKKGRRPSFIAAARPEQAIPLYEQVLTAWRSAGITVATGEFGADMKVELLNDGPVTILLDSKE